MRILGAGSALVVVLIMSGCTCNTSLPENVLQVGNGAEIQELDPHVVSGVSEHRVLSSLFEGLVDCNPATLTPLPGVARSWKVSGDGLTYVFDLRQDAKWSDGESVTAHDFAYAWRRILSPALGSEYAYMLYCLKNAQSYHAGICKDFGEVGVRIVDDYTLEVQLQYATPYFLSMQNHFAWYPVPRKIIEKHGAFDMRGSPWTQPGNFVGNGPFRLADWRPNEVLSVRKNPHYWDVNSVRLSGIDFHPIDNQQTEDRCFRSGLLHITSTIPLHRIEVYRRDRPGVLQIHPYFGSYFYRLNTSRPPFDDPRVRRAFSMALNREELADHVLKGGEAAAYSFVPPGIENYAVAARVVYDVEKARSLLAEAGFPGGRGLPPIEVLYNTSEAHRTIAETVQRMWRESLNVDVRLLNQDWKVYLSSMDALDYAVVRSAWIGDVADPVNFLECFQTGVGNNRTGWSSQEYDALIAAAYRETDEMQRMSLLQQAETLLLEESPIVPIYFYTWKFLKMPEVGGLVPNILGYMRWKDMYFSGE